MESTPKTFSPAILAELGGGYLSDNGLCALEVAAGEPVGAEQILELAAGARALFLVVTLACRQSDSLKDCTALWGALLKLYERALSTWDGASPTSELERAYLGLLERLEQLSGDRLGLYSENGWERETLVSRKSW